MASLAELQTTGCLSEFLQQLRPELTLYEKRKSYKSHLHSGYNDCLDFTRAILTAGISQKSQATLCRVFIFSVVIFLQGLVGEWY